MKDKNRKLYEQIESGDAVKEPSYMGIIPKDKNFELSKDYLQKVIKANPEFELILIEEDVIGAQKTFELTINYHDETYTLLVAKIANDPEYLQTQSFANRVSDEDAELALNADYYIDVSTMFQSNALESYFFQLKVLDTIVPNACLGMDVSAMKVFSPDWLKMLIDANIAPSPEYLYAVHTVYQGEEEDRNYWFHTHGLLRCGSMELEVVNFKYGSEQIFGLLNYIATLFIENHYKENEIFAIGYDGLNMNAAWIKWEDALMRFPANILGGMDERQDKDDVHTGPSGVLFAVEDGNFVSLEIYVDTLKNNPIVYISTEETNRMRALALSQLDVFKQTFEKCGKKTEKKGLFSFLGKKQKEEEQEWVFMVKLGLVVDHAKDEDEREHLWFEVSDIDGDKVTAKLLNEPYWIAKLKEGKTYTYPIQEVLTDWTIYSPDFAYSPDSAYLLSEILNSKR